MSLPARSYRDLIAWQKSITLSEEVYLATRCFPADERFGLTNQVRRAAVSVASNIAEGQGRGSTADFVRFLWMANGSLQGVETQIILSGRFAYLAVVTVDQLLAQTEELGRVLYGLISSLSSN